MVPTGDESSDVAARNTRGARRRFIEGPGSYPKARIWHTQLNEEWK